MYWVRWLRAASLFKLLSRLHCSDDAAMKSEDEVDIIEMPCQDFLDSLTPHDEFGNTNICPVCNKAITEVPLLWLTYSGLGVSLDLFIHTKCLEEYHHRKTSFPFRKN